MNLKHLQLILVSLILFSPGCIGDDESEDENKITTIDPNHPFAGEWTAQSVKMYFFEYENSCSLNGM